MSFQHWLSRITHTSLQLSMLLAAWHHLTAQGMQAALQLVFSERHNTGNEYEYLYVKVQDVPPRTAQHRQTGSHHSHMYRHTHSTAAADVQQWESATYFSVVFLACWLRILTVVVSRRPAAGICLSVITFILLISPWPRRAHRVGLRLLNTTLDLHLPLQCLEEQGRKMDELNRWTANKGLIDLFSQPSLPHTHWFAFTSLTAGFYGHGAQQDIIRNY